MRARAYFGVTWTVKSSAGGNPQAWSDAIRGALLRLRDNGLISAGADLDALTTITLSAIQGGLLLAKTTRDVSQLRTPLAGAIAQLSAYAPPRRARRRG